MYCLNCHDIIHRDLKPQNLLLTNDLQIKLCDFGLSRKGDEEMLKTICGTKEFMAPEIFDIKPYSYPVDVFSYGTRTGHRDFT